MKAEAGKCGGRASSALVALLALGQLTCNQAIMTAPPGSTITLFANPTFIAADGGVSVISALIIEPAGTPAPDGTVVQFFTSLGRIAEQGKTNDGVARVNLVGDGRSGTASISAFSGGPAVSGPDATPGDASGGAVSVTIGNVNAANIIVVAEPSRITTSRSTRVIATVLDSAGNPVSGAPVVFQVTTNPATEFMDAQGRPIFTDNNGRAEDVMRTRRSTSGTAVVRATAPGPDGLLIEGSVSIPIAFE